MSRLRLALILTLMMRSFGQAESVQTSAPTQIELESDATSNRSIGLDEALTLADLEQLAFRFNPTLANASARMNAARGRRQQAGLYPNPTVGYHAMQIGNLGTAGQQGAFVAQRFITGGKIAFDQAIAGKEFDEAHFQFHVQEKRVLSDVRVRFYETQVAQRRLELAEELARIGDEFVAATYKLVEGRQGTENDLLQAEIRADESRILADNARNELHEAWRRLMTVVGMPTMEIEPLAGSLETDLLDLDWESCHAMVLGCNSELNAAIAHADRARIAFHRAKREPIPNVDVTVSVRHHNVTSDDVVNVQAGIPLPIFDKNQGNIRAARAAWIAACHDVKRVELNLLDRLAVAYRRYVNAKQQVARYKQRMVPNAKRSLELVTEGYERGQVEFLNVLNAQQTYVQVSLAYLDSLRQCRVAVGVIEGQLLTDSLTTRMQ